MNPSPVRIPFSVIGGLLGAGKTRWLQRWLQHWLQQGRASV